MDRTDRNGRVTVFAYDSLNRRVTESWLDGNGRQINKFDFTYDVIGRLLSATDNDPGLTSSYDAAGRLVSTSQSTLNAPQVTLSYSYDAVGNRIQTLETIAGVGAGRTTKNRNTNELSVRGASKGMEKNNLDVSRRKRGREQ